jgi:hypothetical protein
MYRCNVRPVALWRTPNESSCDLVSCPAALCRSARDESSSDIAALIAAVQRLDNLIYQRKKLLAARPVGSGRAPESAEA